MRQALLVSAHNEAYTYLSVKKAICEILDGLQPRLSSLVKRGDRIFVKPYMQVPGASAPDDRRKSHPLVVLSLIEALQDYGAVVSFGDEGSRRFWNPKEREGKGWMYDIERRTGARLVNFAQTGARQIR
jgi:uncharacterized protein (DUF362 family)